MAAENKTDKYYCLIDPDYCRPGYIGTTVNDLPTRLTEHVSEALHGKGSKAKQAWIKDITDTGSRPTIMELPRPMPHEIAFFTTHYPELCEGAESWELAERYWIWRFRAAGYKLVNAAAGGKGQAGTTHTDEARAKISKSITKWHQTRKQDLD